MRKLILPLLVILGACSCESGLDTPPSEGGPVSLVVPIDRRLFADDAVMEIQLWNAAQLAALDANARCLVVNDPAGGTRIQCPPGVTFQEVTPERFSFPLSAIGASVELTSRSITGGEMFRLHLSALSRDRCNATSADLVRAAPPGRTVLGDLDWRTTLRACVSPPPR